MPSHGFSGVIPSTFNDSSPRRYFYPGLFFALPSRATHPQHTRPTYPQRSFLFPRPREQPLRLPARPATLRLCGNTCFAVNTGCAIRTPSRARLPARRKSYIFPPLLQLLLSYGSKFTAARSSSRLRHDATRREDFRSRSCTGARTRDSSRDAHDLRKKKHTKLLYIKCHRQEHT